MKNISLRTESLIWYRVRQGDEHRMDSICLPDFKFAPGEFIGNFCFQDAARTLQIKPAPSS